MSTIVYRDGVMAADTRAYTGRHNPPIGRKWKIRRLHDGTLIGVTTNEPGMGEAIMEWFESGADPNEVIDTESFNLLVVTPDGKAKLAVDCFHFTGPIEGDFFAIGSGGPYALGALQLGATAEEAAKVATVFDEFSAEPIYKLEHGSLPAKNRKSRRDV